MNTPNKLTILRTCLIPIFIVVYLFDGIPFNNYIATAIFVAASLTDFFDGYLARKYNLITNFGKFLDPLADKMLVNSALLCFLVVPDNPMPFWVVLVIIMRDFIINGFRLVASDNDAVIAADYWGKVKTTVQMIMVIVLLVDFNNTFFNVIEIILIYASVILTVLSLIDCLIKNAAVLSGAPKKKTTDELCKKIIDILKEKNETISFAESCTGGLLASALIDVPGSSSVLKQSVVTYCNEAKMKYLNVSEATINKYTEVSEACACEMAMGVCEWAQSDIGVAVTGIAGPDGETEDNPVGTVYIAVSYKNNRKAVRHEFAGGRNEVRERSVLAALAMIFDTISM